MSLQFAPGYRMLAWFCVEDLSQSVGKVRLFIHPEIAPILRQFLPRDKLLEMISTILKSPVGYHRH